MPSTVKCPECKRQWTVSDTALPLPQNHRSGIYLMFCVDCRYWHYFELLFSTNYSAYKPNKRKIRANEF